MRSDLKYDRDRPIRRLEAGDVAVISVIHFPESIVRDRDKIKYAHIPNGKYLANVVEPYHLYCEEYPELSGKYNYWRGDKYGCSDGIYAYELKQEFMLHCDYCVCRKCLYWWSSRCPYGGCYDDKRAIDDPYDRAHPNDPPRTAWSNWSKPGEQAHWCRGGIFYPTRYCEKFIKYEGSMIEKCIDCNIQVFQDGHISCSLKDTIGCESCIRENEGRNLESTYDCQYMTDTGCSRMITAKNLILDEIMSGGVIEMCKEQCCRGCIKVCEYRCGQ